MAQLEAEVRELRARLNRHSGNSSPPPSANPPSAPVAGRGRDALRELFGSDIRGTLSSDRWGAYGIVDLARRQLLQVLDAHQQAGPGGVHALEDTTPAGGNPKSAPTAPKARKNPPPGAYLSVEAPRAFLPPAGAAAGAGRRFRAGRKTCHILRRMAHRPAAAGLTKRMERRSCREKDSAGL